MSLAFRMERSAAWHDEPIGLAVTARNDSSSSVKKVTIELKQAIFWSANGHRSAMDQTLASIPVLPGSELGGLQWAPDTGGDYGRSAALVEEIPHTDLEQRLANGAGTRFQLVVPEYSLPTLQVENINITHSVGVVVHTGCCIAQPCVWVPLTVVQTAAPEAQPGATSLAPPQTIPSLPPQTAQHSAGPYGSAPIAPYPSAGMTYGSVQTATGPKKNLPSGIACGTEPGLALGMHHPTQQVVQYSGVEMDEYGHAKPGYVPSTAG